MPEWLEIVLVIAGWIAISRWVLPRFGVHT
jgi:hypothetical protein